MPGPTDKDAQDYYELAKMAESDAVGSIERNDWRDAQGYMELAQTQALLSIAGSLVEIVNQTKKGGTLAR